MRLAGNNLKSAVISDLFEIDVEVDPMDTEVCHRIGNPTLKTILRFINRKNCERFLANRNILSPEKCNFHAGTKVFVNENLTPINDTISCN